MSLKIVSCDLCNISFKREISHINRNNKLNRGNFCSLSHAAILNGFGDLWKNKKREPRSVEHIEKLRNAHIGKPGYWTGKKLPQKMRKKISKTLILYFRRNGFRLSSEDIKERNSTNNKNFIQKIFKRDQYNCQICNRHGVRFECDHIMPWSLFKELRYNSDNCRTLCKDCHKKYGANPHRNPKKWAISPINHLHLRSV